MEIDGLLFAAVVATGLLKVRIRTSLPAYLPTYLPTYQVPRFHQVFVYLGHFNPYREKGRAGKLLPTKLPNFVVDRHSGYLFYEMDGPAISPTAPAAALGSLRVCPPAPAPAPLFFNSFVCQHNISARDRKGG